MAAEEKWYFTREQLANTPSRKSGYDADKELSCRQQAANFIQDMGQRLQVYMNAPFEVHLSMKKMITQLCINTAIVYMHRFYMFHSFTRFHRNAMAAAALFLAAKVEEQPRKLEHVIKVAQICLHREQPPPDVKSEVYIEQAQELVVNENILLQTLGFDVAIDHPHTHVVRCCHLVRASKDLAQTSYFMASNSLHLTTMCLQYKPTVVACFCIHLACKWSNWEIPQSTEGKPWFWYVDKSVTQELLEQLTEEFLAIFEKCPSRLKKKITSLSSTQNPTILSAFSNEGDKKRNGEGSSSNPTSATGANFGGNDDLKKKQEYLRHHPDYKKHHIPHHARSEGHISKSSCMFGPPTRPLPPSHISSTNSSTSGSGSSSILRSVPNSKPSAADPGSLLGKPEHLHHRPRRPDEKHPRNHELIPSQYKKYDKVSSGVISDFMPSNVGNNNSNNNNSSNNNINNNNNNNSNNNSSCSNRANMGANNNSYINVPLSHVQSSSSVYLHQQQQQQLQTQSQVTNQTAAIPHQQGQNVEVLARMGVVESSSNSTVGQSSHVLASLSKHQLLPPQSTQAITTLPHSSITNTRVKSPVLLPPHSKVERSIFSPEKNTPPSEGTKLPRSSSQSPSASSFVTATPHVGTNTTMTTSHAVSATTISSTVLRKKNETTTDAISNVSHPKVDEIQKPSLQNQYHSTHGESVKSETIPKEEKPPDAMKHNEGNISHSTETLAGQPIVSIPIASINASEEPHTKEQKKKKKKHKEHKEKHKDKHKHKHKSREPEPIVITIPKEKLTLPQQAPEQGLLKIKIAKDKIATSISAAPSGLKIKIPKEKIKESRKRERSEERAPGLPGKLHRPNGTTLQVNKAIDIMECSDSENDKPNLSLESTNSPPIALNDACPSFDEILRPGTPPGMSDVLLELIQPEVSNYGTDVTATSSEDKEISRPQISAPAPPVSVKTEAKKQLNEILNECNVEVDPGKAMLNENNVQNKNPYHSRQNGGFSRGRYPGGRRRGRGYHLAGRIAPSHPPPQSAYVGSNNWEVMRHGPPSVGIGGPLPPPGYMLGPPPGIHPSHFFAPTMIVPNFPPPPPLPDDPPPQQPPPPPPE